MYHLALKNRRNIAVYPILILKQPFVNVLYIAVASGIRKTFVSNLG